MRICLVGLLAVGLVACGHAQHTQAAGGKPRVIVRNGKIETLSPLTFEYDSDRLTADSQLTLDAVADVLKGISNERHVRIDGYCDERGDDGYNQSLSVRRARAVKEYLVSHGEIASERLETEGHGRAAPVADNATEAGRAKNRRVEFILLEK